MKKLLIALAIVTGSFTAAHAGSPAVFDGEEKVNARVLDAFNREFRTAKEIIWTIGASYYEASFVYNDQYITAYYNMDGELIGLARNIMQEYLPLALQIDLKKNYKDYWISNLFEVAKDNDTAYYITVEDADAKMVLKATDGRNWNVFKKVKKA